MWSQLFELKKKKKHFLKIFWRLSLGSSSANTKVVFFSLYIYIFFPTQDADLTRYTDECMYALYMIIFEAAGNGLNETPTTGTTNARRSRENKLFYRANTADASARPRHMVKNNIDFSRNREFLDISVKISSLNKVKSQTGSIGLTG